MTQIEGDRKVQFHLDDEIFTAPAIMSDKLTTQLKEAMAWKGLEPLIMSSGAGHDAAVFSNAGVPTGIVFIRNRNGSHNPDEAMDVNDFLIGSEIIYEYLTRSDK